MTPGTCSVAILAAAILTAPFLALADDAPLSVPETGDLHLELGASHLRADRVFGQDRSRGGLDSQLERLTGSAHDGTVATTTVTWVAGSVALYDGIALGVGAPLIAASRSGDEGDDLSATAVGDVAAFFDFSYDYERATLDGGLEPVTIRVRLFSETPVGQDPGDGELGTGNGEFDVGVVTDGYQRRGATDLEGEIGYTYTWNDAFTGGLLQAELGLGRWLTPKLRLSLAALFYTRDGATPAVAYGRTGELRSEVRASLISIAPQIGYAPSERWWLTLGLRGRRSTSGFTQLDTGVPLWGRNDLASTIPPITLGVAVTID